VPDNVLAATSVADELRTLLGSETVLTDPDLIESYRRDNTPLIDAGRPMAVVRARSIDDVVATLEVADRTGTPVVTRGAGTGLAGGANALDGCIVLSTKAMNRILDIDELQRTAIVQCGVITGDVAEAVAQRGLWYPPDPSSGDISTIGGNIATNAGGACCLKYGVTGDHIAALTVVLADGSVLHTGRTTRKNVAGLDLTRLLVGSEGALAVIVEATLRLRVARRESSTLVAFFPSAAAAGLAVVEIELTMEPSLLEFMDRTTIGAVELMTCMGLDTGAGALLLVQSDGPTAGDDIDRAAKACEAAGATRVVPTANPKDGELFLAARRAALPALERMGTSLLDDVAVPKPLIPKMLDEIARIAERHGVIIGTFGHLGDGNLHPTIVFERGDGASELAARAAFDEIARTALDLGGTITGEHGVGSLKIPYLTDMVGADERALMTRIKAAFDPNGILNPGRAV
jgi:glycolate dehydrogenase FAD-linked subunit